MNYKEIFDELKIDVKPLPSNYTPDEFANELMRGFNNASGVSYAISTDYDMQKKKEVVCY